MRLKCVIVDDEPLAQDILESYVLKIDYLELVAKCSNALEAIQVLQNEKVDLLFLDINMPVLSGLDMLKSIQNSPHVILTTAYSEYAVQSYELNVKDYLLKPIAFDRFLTAINKITPTETAKPETDIEEDNTNTFMFFKADKTVYKFYYDEILFFEGYGNYVKVHSSTKKTILVLDKLSSLENKLISQGFKRVHKSYLINLSKVNEISGNQIMIDDTKIPIGQSHKESFWNEIMKK